MKKGITLVMLVVVIIVALIITSAVVVLFNGNDIIEKAEMVQFDTDVLTIQEMAQTAIAKVRIRTPASERIDALEENNTEEENLFLNMLQPYDYNEILQKEINGHKYYELFQISDSILCQSDSIAYSDNDKDIELSQRLSDLGISDLEYFADPDIYVYSTSNTIPGVTYKKAILFSTDNVKIDPSVTVLRLPNVIYDDEGNKQYIDTIDKGINNISTIYPNVEKIVVSNGIQYMANEIFDGCENLETVILPKTLRNLHFGTFKNCTKLTNIKLPDGLRIIGTGAFENCTSLTKVTIPESVDTMNNEVFLGCSNYLEITVNSGKPVYDANPYIYDDWNYNGNVYLKTIYRDKTVEAHAPSA